jgi:murein DD-endopeptidase MepM/ murein hydrolase activator NlpD
LLLRSTGHCRGCDHEFSSMFSAVCRRPLLFLILALLGLSGFGRFAAAGAAEKSGIQARPVHGLRGSGLAPRYPEGFSCPHLTSLYGSWIDVDGRRRREIHTGVDGGRLGDWILAPGPGVIKRVWNANWGWGWDGALLMLHTRQDLGLEAGPEFYYSEFDHLRWSEIVTLKEGQRIARGQPLGHVWRPGGNQSYRPEVHWEVWKIHGDRTLRWAVNRHGAEYWTNASGNLINPLHMLASARIHEDSSVQITPFIPGASYRGFTYIFPCQPQR